MQFYLVNNLPLCNGFVASKEKTATRTSENAAYHFAIFKSDPKVEPVIISTIHNIQCDILNNIILEKSSGKKFSTDPLQLQAATERKSPWKVSIVVGRLEYDGTYIGIRTEKPSLMDVLDHPGANVSAHVLIQLTNGQKIMADNMKKSARNPALYFAREESVTIPEMFWSTMEAASKRKSEEDEMRGTCSIVFSISDDIPLFSKSVSNPKNTNRIILENDSDFTIISRDNKRVKAVKAFLKAHCEFFNANFENPGYKENITNEHVTFVFNGECMQALVNYCAYGDISSLRTDPALTFEIISAAQYYQCNNLLTDATQALLDRKFNISNQELIEIIKLSFSSIHRKSLHDGLLERLRRQMKDAEFGATYKLLFGCDPDPLPEILPKLK